MQASATSWFGRFLLSKIAGECVEVWEQELGFGEELVTHPSQGAVSLQSLVEERRRDRRSAVDFEALAQRKGLLVWEARHFDGYWCPEFGEFNGLPEGWDILLKGDAALTTRVRQGSHWILKRKAGEYPVVVGTAAPAQNIERAFEELGGEDGAVQRQKGKERGQGKREQHLTEQLEAAILRLFPRIPKEDLDEILGEARSTGSVGTAQWLYFQTGEGSAKTFDRAAYLAVQAHVRHRYTDYEEIPAEWDKGFSMKEAKMAARSAVAPEIDDILESWR